MNFRGERTTRTGRVVYNRKPHIFTERDAARIVRGALNFPDYNFQSGMQAYADMTWRSFVNWSFRYNFWPMHRMFYTELEENPDAILARQIAGYVASYLGVPEVVVTLGEALRDFLMGSQWHEVIKLKPYFSSIIVNAAFEAGTIYEEDIYGRKRSKKPAGRV